MNLEDFLKELVSLEYDNENPSADVWYNDILRGKCIIPGQPNHIMIWWELDDTDPEQKRIKDKASVLNESSFVDIKEKKILVYDDRDDYFENCDYLEGVWIIMSYDKFIKWIVEYEDFFNRPINFEYEPVHVAKDYGDEYNDELSCDEFVRIEGLLESHRDAFEDILRTYKDDISNTIFSFYHDTRQIDYKLRGLEDSLAEEVEVYIHKLLSKHNMSNYAFVTNTCISYTRRDYPGEVTISCWVYI